MDCATSRAGLNMLIQGIRTPPADSCGNVSTTVHALQSWAQYNLEDVRTLIEEAQKETDKAANVYATAADPTSDF